MADELDTVVPLDELDDFKVAEGDPDVRGWDVLSADGRKIGEVENLLVDTAAMKVRYLEVDVDRDVIDASEERHILVPIGYARLDEDDDQVRVDALNSTDVMGLPEYRRGSLTREYETSVRQRFDAGFAPTGAETDLYGGTGYDDSSFFGSRRSKREGEARIPVSEEQLAIGREERESGHVEVDKEVETRHVREDVPTRHEEVVVERRPASAGMSAKPRIEEDEIRVPVTEEELVVEKRVVPKEEVVVKKREVVENETVEADLRRERVDVHGEGDVRIREEGDPRRER
jgi:uncharacterized protein (TIGR02271 family)